MNWYDYPQYYDVSFSHEMQSEIAFLRTLFSSIGNKKKKTRLLEPACGSGRLIVPLAKAGFACTGLDMNTAAIDYLKKNWNDRTCMPA